MREILVNALSVTNPSGRHVLLGHLGQAVAALQGRIRFAVLCREDSPLREELGDRADWVSAPGFTRQWALRSAWERTRLPGLVRDRGARACFTSSGFAASGLGIPQIVFCQNPWALVPDARRPRDAAKAWLQRRAYRRAARGAGTLVFLSRYMQEAYRANAGLAELDGRVAYAGIDEAVRARAAARPPAVRKTGQIVCASLMARHKNIETPLRALARLRAAGHPEARLVLAGSWPDAAYERRIRDLAAVPALRGAVEFAGFVPRARLEDLYAESQVFCLMSRCESFGIPAIEAQAFGTPVVSSSVCAIPEICGAGGLYVRPDDVDGVTRAWAALIGDAAEWRRMSGFARANADRFVWEKVSRPLVERFAEFAD
jgi:glycosyltransferase involved in cell wall biosynthesis